MATTNDDKKSYKLQLVKQPVDKITKDNKTWKWSVTGLEKIDENSNNDNKEI